MLNFRHHLLPALVFCAAMYSTSCSREEYILMQGQAQGGIYSVKCKVDTRMASALKEGIDSVLAEIDNSLSGYNPTSALSRRNRGENLYDRHVNRMEWFCDSLYEATGGILDTRAGALFDLWGFGFKEGSFPTEEQVAAAMQERFTENFNAVAQGYSADKVAEYLFSKGVTDLLVDVGGEILCSGVNPSGTGWTIGIDAPEDGSIPGRRLEGKFTLPPGGTYGVVTSGNYRKFFIRDGVKYPHTIDPRTGYPVTHKLLSATIIAPTSALADALATVAMVLGPEKAREMIEGRSDIEGCLISAKEEGEGCDIWCSEGFELN